MFIIGVALTALGAPANSSKSIPCFSDQCLDESHGGFIRLDAPLITGTFLQDDIFERMRMFIIRKLPDEIAEGLGDDAEIPRRILEAVVLRSKLKAVAVKPVPDPA